MRHRLSAIGYRAIGIGYRAIGIGYRAIGIGLSVALVACSHPALEKAETEAAVPVSVETAVVGTIESTVNATGMVQPAPGADWTITAPEAARIAELPKAEGDAIAVGDLLVRFDIPTLPAELESKKSAVAQARAQLTQSTAELNRVTPLVDKGVAAPKDVEAARRARDEAAAALSQAESAVAAVTALLERVTVRATFAGVIAKRWHSAGDLVEASASDPVLRVIDPHALQIAASVPVADISRVGPGHTGFVIGPSGEGEPVRVLTKPPQVDAATTMADVRLVFTKPTRLMPGTPVQVVLMAETHEKAVIIPAAALVRDEDEVYVMVIDKDNKAHRHDVEIGLKSAEKVEILSGVAAGDVVAMRGQAEVPDGGTVTIVK
jgi:RND family efflux transporter MFP subunit